MKRSVILALAVPFLLAACASDPKKDGQSAATAGQKSGTSAQKDEKKSEPWWKLSNLKREPGFHVPIKNEIRPGRGLLSNTEDGLTIYNELERGSADPNKPRKVRR